jgi:hypothetical protein
VGRDGAKYEFDLGLARRGIFLNGRLDNGTIRRRSDLPVRQSRDPPEAVGAVAHGASACNGSKFWHIETKKDLIDELRADIRSGMTILKKYCGALGGRFTYPLRLWAHRR